MKKKIGIIGCGAVTEKLYFKTLPNLKEYDIAYLSDRDEARAAKLAAISKSEVVDVDTLNRQSDVIIICTPPSSHYELVKSALVKDKVVVCEKPFLAESAKVPELAELAKKAGSDLYVAHFRRLFPSVLLAKELIKTLNPGNLLSIEISEGGRFNWGAKSDYFVENPLGGVTLDTGSHTIDMALFIAGLDTEDLTPKMISCKKDKTEPSHEVHANIGLQLADHVIDVKVHLSRYRILSNQIVYTFKDLKIVVPSGLSNYIKVSGPNGSSVLYAPNKFKTLPETFYAQYRHIFNKINNDYFRAERFYNLTQVLELINNG